MTVQTTAQGQAEGLLITGQRNILSNVRVIGSGDALQVNGPTTKGRQHHRRRRRHYSRSRPGFSNDACKSRSVFMWIGPSANHGNVFKDCVHRHSRADNVGPLAKERHQHLPHAEPVLINATLSGVLPVGWGAADEGARCGFGI
jgi:hypothetical protein